MTQPAAQVSMLIRRPPGDVFDAFVQPARLTQFWLASASAPLQAGARVTWEFMVPGAKDTLTVTAFQPPSRLAFDWSDGMHVDMAFEPHGEGATHATVKVTGFADGALDGIVNTAEGFSIVLCDLKTWLETGRSASLVKDKAALITAALNARSKP